MELIKEYLICLLKGFGIAITLSVIIAVITLPMVIGTDYSTGQVAWPYVIAEIPWLAFTITTYKFLVDKGFIN